MSGARNQPVCGVCGRKLVRNGTTSAGRTRWRCRSCGASTTQSRPDITRRAELGTFTQYLLDGTSPEHLAGSRRSFHRKTSWCWRIEVPPPTPTGQIHDVVIMDGTYFQDWCLLIATDGTHVLDWQWTDREKKISWTQILARWPAPKMVVIDGGPGIYAALHETWPTTRIQRCYFHIFQRIRRHVTMTPRLPAGRQILSLTRALMAVEDLDHAAAWLGKYASWDAGWDEFLRHRTYATNTTERPRGISLKQQWWYTHRELRRARKLYRNLIHEGSLFAWLDPELIGPDGPVWPRTTSSLEGGANKALKDLFRRHRGLPSEHARRAAEWLLNDLTEIPRDPWSLVREEHWNPPRRRPAVTPEPEPGPRLGTSFSWEDGNGIQHGWAGRSHP
jgi:hypothetical protein